MYVTGVVCVYVCLSVFVSLCLCLPHVLCWKCIFNAEFWKWETADIQCGTGLSAIVGQKPSKHLRRGWIFTEESESETVVKVGQHLMNVSVSSEFYSA